MGMDVEIILRVQTRETFEVRPTWNVNMASASMSSTWDININGPHYSYDDALDAGNLMLAQHPNVAGFVIAKSYQRIEGES